MKVSLRADPAASSPGRHADTHSPRVTDRRFLRLFAFVALLLAGFAAIGLPARGQAATFHPDLVRAQAEVDRARGAEAYVAIRRIWSTWNRTDPQHVEEALLGASTHPNLSPAARAYAATLAAYARLRRGDLTAARTALRRLGYVDRWLVVGPFDNEGKAGLAALHGPEADWAQPLSSAKAYTGKERPVRWRVVPNAFRDGYLALGALLRPETKVCALAATFVSGPANATKSRPITAWVGSGGAFRLFWNGVEQLSHDRYSAHDFDRLAVRLTLEPGPNLLAIKICGDESAPTLSVRLADERGAPDSTLEFSNDLAHAEAAAALAAKAVAAGASAKPQRAETGVLGPVQVFERLTSRPNATAAELEAYARYLHETDGEDPAVHAARDMARRAAEREPTIERLLLAGKLAEDRNQAGEWIAKAERLAAASGKPNRDVLLARAWHRRHSPNFREALPLFDRVLELEPDNLDAVRGRLELYNLAGLSRTALATVEQAVQRNPMAVGLLGLYAAQLRTLGRTTLAAEVEGRYHGLRYDDASYLAERLELSLDRQDRRSAERWAERLVALEPHDAWALGVAARAYRRLAQPERAIATYRQALALAPEDVGVLRTLADLHGELGQRQEQMALLREILRVRPQDREVRQYVESLEPEKPRPDEAYAWSPDRFLYLRHAPAAGQNRRTLRDLTVTTVFENGLSSKFRQVVFQPLTDATAAQDRQYAFAYEASTQNV